MQPDVYVVGYKVESIDVICDDTLTVGESALLQVATTPVDAKVDKMLYESSDTSIAISPLNTCSWLLNTILTEKK